MATVSLRKVSSDSLTSLGNSDLARLLENPEILPCVADLCGNIVVITDLRVESLEYSPGTYIDGLGNQRYAMRTWTLLDCVKEFKLRKKDPFPVYDTHDGNDKAKEIE